MTTWLLLGLQRKSVQQDVIPKRAMQGSISKFTSRLYSEWLPAFCDAPHRGFDPTGFRDESIGRLNDFDAHWFMNAIDHGLVTEINGFFNAPRSLATEQIFWTGRKNISPRPLTLWIEPIITIGALARLHKGFGWPTNNLGAQSRDWSFDLVCYNDSGAEHIVCEVKKDPKEIRVLLEFMHRHCSVEHIETEPKNSKELNAYRKVQGIRKAWPSVFWALGPRGEGHVFQIRREAASSQFVLVPAEQSALSYPGN